MFEDSQSEKFACPVGAVFATAYVNNLSSVDTGAQLLIDGCSPNS